MKRQTHHHFFEDIIAIFTGSLFIAIGVYLFRTCHFITGGVTGIALLLVHWLPLTFGQIFFILNIPGYYLAWTQMGKRFTLYTFCSVAFVSYLTDKLPQVFSVSLLDPIFAAVLGGLLVGTGILILYRHVASLGGLGVFAVFIQQRFNYSAGKFQMIVDVLILLAGFFTVSFNVFLLSLLSTAALNMVIWINHKPGRYQIT